MAAGTPNFQYGYPTPGPQSPTGQKVMNHVFFCPDSEWKTIREFEQFDFIVIGTGPCGFAFVERILSKQPTAQILMLERGEYFLPEHFQNLPFTFANTVGGMSETYPWTLSRETHDGQYIKYQHGMVPFFGGRSILWSSWCPRPTGKEFEGWPKCVVENANNYFGSAEKLLNVVSVGSNDDKPDGLASIQNSLRPIYDTLQRDITKRIKDNLCKVSELKRAMAAPLAVGITQLKGINFQKFATTGPLLELVEKQMDANIAGTGKRLKIVADCIVEEMYNQDNKATALKTSKGVVNIGDAKLILAMGTIPPSTLIANSFPSVQNVGQHLCSHFISAIVARIKVSDFYGDDNPLKNIEIGAIYVAGVADDDYQKQFHFQVSAFYDVDPEANAKYAFQYAPDVVATASTEQLACSKGYIVFVLACLGEMDVDNEKNKCSLNPVDKDKTTNIRLNLTTNKNDDRVWQKMDDSAFGLLEDIISPKGKDHVEYWHASGPGPNDGKFFLGRPETSKIRVPGTVHESSTLVIGDKDKENTSVGYDYRPHGVENVYVTGGGLWPRAGSWNPTLTMVALTQHLADNLQSGVKKPN